uniref:Uncharacterized protein n=1 Tax=Steinernema glaseri TaxID=37863 RepID=A0A1I8AF03_9BILA
MIHRSRKSFYVFCPHPPCPGDLPQLLQLAEELQTVVVATQTVRSSAIPRGPRSIGAVGPSAWRRFCKWRRASRSQGVVAISHDATTSLSGNILRAINCYDTSHECNDLTDTAVLPYIRAHRCCKEKSTTDNGQMPPRSGDLPFGIIPEIEECLIQLIRPIQNIKHLTDMGGRANSA